MSKYTAEKAVALELITDYGTVGILVHSAVVPSDKPYETSTNATTTEHAIKFVSFANDGVIFAEHNVTVNSRIFTVYPPDGVTIAKGDKIRFGTSKEVTVLDFKRINPDETSDVLWSVLVS